VGGCISPFPILLGPGTRARSKTFPGVRAVGASNSIAGIVTEAGAIAVIGDAAAVPVGYAKPFDCPFARMIAEALEASTVMPWSRPAVARTPVVAVTMMVARTVAMVVHVIGVVNDDAGAPVVMPEILATVIRMPPVAVMKDVQVIRRPADVERRGHTPEIARQE
jgi:hypothetical protein